VTGVLRWSWYSLGGLALYTAFVPLLVAPAVCAAAWRRARGGDRRDLGLASTFVAATVVLVLAVGAFLSTPFGAGRLHDRYLFYVLPLWLVVAAAAARRQARLDRAPLAAGAAIALLAVATLPTRLVLGEGAHLDALGNGIWTELARLAPERPSVVRLLAVASLLVLAAAAALLPARFRVLLAAPVAAVFVANAVLVWNYRIIDGGRPVFSPRTAAAEGWVDGAVPAGADAATLWIGSGNCRNTLVRDAFLWTEFFDERVGIGAAIGAPSSDSLRFHEVRVDRSGALRLASGQPFAAQFVVAPPGIVLAGRVVATGTTAGLRLWQTSGAVRLRGVTSAAEAIRRACS
jgi:hypothetical protein